MTVDAAGQQNRGPSFRQRQRDQAAELVARPPTLVGDAAFCVSLLARQGSRAAGELADAHREYRHAFDGYEIIANVYRWQAAGYRAFCRGFPNAEKAVCAKAFQAWADGRIERTAEDIFETVQEVLET
jgi:hypothetical protein